MLDLHSPITGHAPPTIATDAPLLLSQRAPGAILQVAGWEDFAEAAAPALQALGFEGLGDYRSARREGDAECLRIAPDKLLLRHPDATLLQEAAAKLDQSRAPSLDLSHARWSVFIEGPAVEDLLLRLAPIDVSLRASPVGRFAQTGVHHVGVTLIRLAEHKFEILIPYTWAMSIWEMICDCARPIGFQTCAESQ